jgi:hypothetical protein
MTGRADSPVEAIAMGASAIDEGRGAALLESLAKTGRELAAP